jgi:hypothetical protein
VNLYIFLFELNSIKMGLKILTFLLMEKGSGKGENRNLLGVALNLSSSSK